MDRTDRVEVCRVPLSARQQRWVETAWSFLDAGKALGLDVDLTNIWSYSGHERAIAEFMVDYLERQGVDAFYQPIDPESGNAIGRLSGSRDGATLLLVASSDTHFTGGPDDGLQWGDPSRRDNRLPAEVVGQTVIGLGSENPKALCTAILLAVEAIAKAEITLRGDLIAALAARGAPARAAPDEPRKNVSLGAGVYHMVTHGVVGDFAIYHKPGYGVGWEEQGLNQFKIRIRGDPTYMGRGGYSVVGQAAKVALAFNDWAETTYGARKVGTFRPVAALNVIDAGRSDRPNWSSGVAELYADVRSAPGEPPIRTKYVFDEVMQKICADIPGIDAEWDMVACMPGGHTDPRSWIVQSSIRGTQAVDDDHSNTYVGRTAGQTEMGYLQALGIACAKVNGVPDGVDLHPELPPDIKGFTLSAAYAPHIVKAAQVMVYAAIDTLTRSRDEVGLDH